MNLMHMQRRRLPAYRTHAAATGVPTFRAHAAATSANIDMQDTHVQAKALHLEIA